MSTLLIKTNEKSKWLSQSEIAYKVGALLYAPAIHESLADKIENNSFSAMALCLEDTIIDEALHDAEIALKSTLQTIKKHNIKDIPMIFVRTRSPEHLEYINDFIKSESDIITGFILPKFDSTNAESYKNLFLKINANRQNPLYFMPILESRLIAEKSTRMDELYSIKEILDSVSEYVLNVRVGGNDFCNIFGLRRKSHQTIYDIGVVRDILVDILNVFSSDYVVSGPVWEYFGKDAEGEWAKGLRRELELDRLNGFIGKTAIHPEQLPIIRESLMVDAIDYADAIKILDWKADKMAVEASSDKSRMNEVKCHTNWARKTFILGNLYGIKEN